MRNPVGYKEIAENYAFGEEFGGGGVILVGKIYTEYIHLKPVDERPKINKRANLRHVGHIQTLILLLFLA